MFSEIFLNKINNAQRLEIRTPSRTFVYMKVETDTLKTVGNYAKRVKRNRSRIYQLINETKLETVKIDGVTFVKVEAK